MTLIILFNCATTRLINFFSAGKAVRVLEKQNLLILTGFAVSVSMLLIAPQSSEAAPPFATDDADIAEFRELEIETWIEALFDKNSLESILMLQFGYGATECLELAIGGGLRLDPGPALSSPELYAQIKYRIFRIVDGKRPGMAVTLAYAPDFSSENSPVRSAAHLMLPLTFSFSNEKLMVHANLGIIAATDPEALRIFWGLGMERAISDSDFRVMAEVFAGDTFDPHNTSTGSQAGLIWTANERLVIDFALGAVFQARQIEHPSWTARLGMTWSAGFFSDTQ